MPDPVTLMAALKNQEVGPEIARVSPSEVVFLVGSGVSHALPSGLPTGGDLKKQLLDDLMSHAQKVLSPGDFGQLKRAVVGSSIPNGAGGEECVYGIPFEGILDIHEQLFPDSGRTLKFLSDNLMGAIPNPAHEFLAASLVLNPPVFPNVVTLNYDMLIEEARPNVKWDGIRVATEDEYRAWTRAGSASLLLKLHGSFHVPDTIVATLSTEHGLAQWKRDLLKEIVSDKVLVMIGYSGYDFDVCPVLLKSGPKQVYWNTREPDDELPNDAQELLNRCGQHVYGEGWKLFASIQQNMAAGLASPLPAFSPHYNGSSQTRAVQGMCLEDEEAFRWLVRVAVEVGLGELALQLIKVMHNRWPNMRAEFGMARDEARAHFLLDHTPQELKACKGAYRRALKRAPSSLDAADIWMNYHEPCRLELKYAPGFVPKVLPAGSMVRGLLSARLKMIFRRGIGKSRLCGYWWLRLAQDLENLVRQSPLARYSWLRHPGYAVTEWLLSRADRHFARDDNYFGTQQAKRIRLRVSSASYVEQMEVARLMRDYYRRLGYLTAWSNSDRDIIDILKKHDHLDIAEARRLAHEAFEVSKLAGDRPGMTKAKEILSRLV